MGETIRLQDYDYDLPPDRIAQQPVTPRDAARLLVVSRRNDFIAHHRFADLETLLAPGDLLVVNETRVTALRLFGERTTGGRVEALLLRPLPESPGDTFEALVRPGRKLPPGEILLFPATGLRAEILERTTSGGRILRFTAPDNGAAAPGAAAPGAAGQVPDLLQKQGQVPLPPYITATLPDPERYQTVYARTPGSAAAPTAGLHFTPELLQRLAARGIQRATVRLDVGLGTFRPIQTDDIAAHVMHQEAFDVPPETAAAVNTCRGRVIAVGTTALRALETAARASAARESNERVTATQGETDLFVVPGFEFRAVDALITNFHQPHSTLLLLIGAFAGRDRMRLAYETALRENYRFLSFGDAMLIQ